MAQPSHKNTNRAQILKMISHMERELGELRVAVAQARIESRPRKFKSLATYKFYGMWANREDMEGLTTEEWLEQLRAQQWGWGSRDE